MLQCLAGMAVGGAGGYFGMKYVEKMHGGSLRTSGNSRRIDLAGDLSLCSGFFTRYCTRGRTSCLRTSERI